MSTAADASQKVFSIHIRSKLAVGSSRLWKYTRLWHDVICKRVACAQHRSERKWPSLFMIATKLSFFVWYMMKHFIMSVIGTLFLSLAQPLYHTHPHTHSHPSQSVTLKPNYQMLFSPQLWYHPVPWCICTSGLIESLITQSACINTPYIFQGTCSQKKLIISTWQVCVTLYEKRKLIH